MKRKFISLIIIFYVTGCLVSKGQTIRNCETLEHDKYLRNIYPEYAKERDEMESKIAAYIATHPALRNSGATLVIPVVVHIVYNTSDQNLPDDQIVSQIDVLNEDYSITNANIAEVPSVWAGLVGSSHLFFALARRDENGITTNGIVRKQTSNTSFNIGDDVKHDVTGGSDAWNRNDFLNIWVCNLQGGVLGYAQLPVNNIPATDGIVINYQAFGRVGNNLKSQYNLGRTATHEVGHWFNLVHTWGDDGGKCISDGGQDDHIADTPDQADNTFGCPSFPHITCSDSGPNGDMFQNYMDYTDDKCMMLFTTDQRSRMVAAIALYRESLQFASTYALPVSPLIMDLKILAIDTPAGIVCNKNIVPSLRIQNDGISSITNFSLDYRVDDDSLLHYDWSGTLAPDAITKITLPEMFSSEDLHTFIAKVTSVNGGSDDYPLDNFKTQSFLYSPSKYSCPVYQETPEIAIYPTIASESILIETKYKDTGQKTTLSIYNVLGKKMYTKEYTGSHGQSVNVYIGGLANGIYLAEVKTFNKQVSIKFVVRH